MSTPAGIVVSLAPTEPMTMTLSPDTPGEISMTLGGTPGAVTSVNGQTGDVTIPPGLTNPMTTLGDLIVGGAAGAPGRLAAAASGLVLTANGPGVAPTYQAAAGGGAGQSPWIPQDNNLVAANFDPILTSGTGTGIGGGLITLSRLDIRQACTIGALWYLLSAAGSGASSGSFAGLYSSSGVLLTGSSDVGSLLATTGPVKLPLTTPQALSAGSFVWAAIVVNLAGSPSALVSALGTGALAPSVGNLGLPVAQSRWALVDTNTHTSLPSSFTPSGIAALNAHNLWAGASAS